MKIRKSGKYNQSAHVLNEQILKIISNYDVKKIDVGVGLITLRNYHSYLSKGIKEWPIEQIEHIRDFKELGLQVITDESYWLRLEVEAHRLLKLNISVPFLRALSAFFQLFSVSLSVSRPTIILLHGVRISLIEIYVLDLAIGNQLKKSITLLKLEGKRTNNTTLHIVRNVIQIVTKTMHYRPSLKNLEVVYKLSIIEFDKIFPHTSLKRARSMRSCFKTIMVLFEPEKYGKIIIGIQGLKLDLTKVVYLSPVLKEQLNKLLSTAYYRGQYGHNFNSIQARLSHALKILRKFCKSNREFSQLFKLLGLNALSQNNFKMLKKINETFPKKDSNTVRNIYEHFSRTSIKTRELSGLVLIFPDLEFMTKRSLDISPLMVFGSLIINQIKELHIEELKLLNQKNYSLVTLLTYFTKLVSVLSKYGKKNVIKEHGIRFLSINNGIHQLQVLSKIQSDVFANKISRRTAQRYNSSLKWLCEISNQKHINAYRITSNRHALHARRLSINDTYTSEEVKELAFYMEKAIASKHYDGGDLLALYFARVQFKTCWNTSSLVRIECSDIVEVDVPTKSRPVLVLLQKARKGYKTDTFQFDSKVTRSAIHDLKYVKNHLTLDTRKKFKDNDLHTRIFINEVAGKLKPIDFRAVIPRISKVLFAQGCTVKYNSMKLRKTGANVIYNQVAKDIRKYKKILRHSYPTFLKHYQRINEVKTQATLHEATAVMDKYFVGRVISSKINIVTDYSENTQVTPIGGCDADKYSIEAQSYKKTHSKLQSGKTSKRCCEFLACVWCKYYRIVADTDHVWQLLSFKKYVLGDMEATIAHFNDESLQKQAIDTLHQRVDSIITAINRVNKKPVNDAKNLIETKGMHPSWEFALPMNRIEI